MSNDPWSISGRTFQLCRSSPEAASIDRPTTNLQWPSTNTRENHSYPSLKTLHLLIIISLQDDRPDSSELLAYSRRITSHRLNTITRTRRKKRNRPMPTVLDSNRLESNATNSSNALLWSWSEKWRSRGRFEVWIRRRRWIILWGSAMERRRVRLVSELKGKSENWAKWQSVKLYIGDTAIPIVSTLKSLADRFRFEAWGRSYDTRKLLWSIPRWYDCRPIPHLICQARRPILMPTDFVSNLQMIASYPSLQLG